MSLPKNIARFNKLKNDLILKSYEYYLENGDGYIISPYEIGEKINLKVFDDGSFEAHKCIVENQKSLLRIIKELNEDGLIHHLNAGLGGIKTTPKGRKYAENKFLPTENDSISPITIHNESVNIQAGPNANIQIQKDSNNSSQVIKKKDDIINKIDSFIKEYEKEQHNLKLNTIEIEEIKVDIDTIKTQLKSPNPKGLK